MAKHEKREPSEAALRVGRRIAWHIERVGWSQRRLARECGVSEATVSGWVNTGSIKVENLERITKALEIDAGYFWGAVVPEPPAGDADPDQGDAASAG